jgi:hypothetical protein
MQNRLSPARFLLMAPGMFVLLTAWWGGLVRQGWVLSLCLSKVG